MSKLSRWIVLSVIVAFVLGIVALICAKFGAFAQVEAAINKGASLAFLAISVIMFIGEIAGTICIWNSKTIPDVTVDKPKK